MRWLVALLLLAPAVVPPLAAGPAEDADAILHKTVDAVLGFLDDTTLSRKMKRQKIVEVTTPVFDFDLMAYRTVGGKKYWPRFSAEQKKEFTGLFVKQLQRTYFEKAVLFSHAEVTYEPPVVTKKGRVQVVEVKLNISSKGDRMTSLYRMRPKDGTWRIYDVEVNSVSIVKSYRASFLEQLRSGSPADLIANLRAKVSANADD